MCRTAILKNDSTAEKKRVEEAFALASIAHYCFVETKTNCAPHRETGRAPDEDEAKKSKSVEFAGRSSHGDTS